jgi:hypothetical protein
LAVDYIASFLDRLTRDEVQRYYERYIRPYFTSDGRVDLNVAQHAVDAVATELGVAAASVTRCTSTPCDRGLAARARNSGRLGTRALTVGHRPSECRAIELNAPNFINESIAFRIRH